jgi:hypothetical protein
VGDIEGGDKVGGKERWREGGGRGGRCIGCC